MENNFIIIYFILLISKGHFRLRVCHPSKNRKHMENPGGTVGILAILRMGPRVICYKEHDLFDQWIILNKRII